MDGKEKALDNIRIERLWRSLKYENIYLKRYETMKDLKAGIDACFNFYNTARFHQLLDYNDIGENTNIWQFCVVFPQAKIGSNCNIFTQILIENEVVIGNNVTIKSGVQI